LPEKYAGRLVNAGYATEAKPRKPKREKAKEKDVEPADILVEVSTLASEKLEV